MIPRPTPDTNRPPPPELIAIARRVKRDLRRQGRAVLLGADADVLDLIEQPVKVAALNRETIIVRLDRRQGGRRRA